LRGTDLQLGDAKTRARGVISAALDIVQGARIPLHVSSKAGVIISRRSAGIAVTAARDPKATFERLYDVRGEWQRRGSRFQ
jgi:hypothetical protein